MLFQQKSVQQVATLPYIPVGGGIDVLLITSRHGGRWLLPKGWPASALTLAEAARREAAEEAGVTGDLSNVPLGSYSYRKSMNEGYRVRCDVFVFPLLVREQSIDWPEKTQRAMRWCGLAEAARLVEDRGLVRLLGDLARIETETFLERAAPVNSLPADADADVGADSTSTPTTKANA